MKAVQLDLEAKGIIARETVSPLRLHKVWTKARAMRDRLFPLPRMAKEADSLARRLTDSLVHQYQRLALHGHSLGHAPAQRAIKRLGIVGIEMKLVAADLRGMMLHRPDQRPAKSAPAEGRGDDQPGKPWADIMKRADLVAHEQAGADRPAVDLRHKGGFVAVATQQFEEARGILVQRALSIGEEGGMPERGDHPDIGGEKRADGMLHG